MTQQAKITQAQIPRRRMSDQFKFKVYSWVEWAMKAILLAGVTMIWQIQNGVQEMKTSQSNQALVQIQQAEQIQKLEQNQEAIRRDYVSRMEILEMMKRIEMQFTINRLEKGR